MKILRPRFSSELSPDRGIGLGDRRDGGEVAESREKGGSAERGGKKAAGVVAAVALGESAQSGVAATARSTGGVDQRSGPCRWLSRLRRDPRHGDWQVYGEVCLDGADVVIDGMWAVASNHKEDSFNSKRETMLAGILQACNDDGCQLTGCPA